MIKHNTILYDIIILALSRNPCQGQATLSMLIQYLHIQALLKYIV